MLNTPDIDLRTIKLFIQEFSNCLTVPEREKHSILIEMINEFTLIQMTVKNCVNQIKTDNLVEELEKLKKN